MKPTHNEAQLRVDELAERIAAEFPEDLVSASGESPEEVVLAMLSVRRFTLAVAESCTGGLLASRLTAVSHASEAFVGGGVVYTDELKTLFAGVPKELVQEHGAVSEPVARALAEGMRARTQATIAISITGLAGPSGGSPGADESKPIGLIYLGLSTPQGTSVAELNLQGDRDRIRWWATQHALKLLRQHLLRLV